MVVMRSCCCCNMRTGSMLVAVIYMIATGLILTGLGLMVGYFDSFFKPILNLIMYDLPFNISQNLTTTIATQAASTAATTKNVVIASIILKSLYFLLCLLLFIGASKENPSYMTPWLVAEFFRQVIFFASFCFMSWCTSVLIVKQNIDGTVLVLFCVLMLLFIALTFYFWLAVVAASQEFREKERQVSPESKDPYAAERVQDPYIIYE